MHPNAYPNRLLLCVTGMSPQIVTETLFALTQTDVAGERFVPTELHLISTRRGAENARLKLLGDHPAWFAQLRAEWNIPPIRFGAEQIHIIQREDGSMLDDIRDDDDNRLAADFIAEKVRALTADAQCAVHASMAGGRKTMGFYLGYAMSLYGRAQDRLSHVLVSAPFESHPQFYYPSARTRVITALDRTQEALDCATAKVWLGDIPFVRLRDGLPDRLLHGKARFSEAIAEAQRALAPPSLCLQPATLSVIAQGERIVFPPLEFALYWMYTERCARGLAGIHWTQADFVPSVLAKHRQLVGAHSGEAERTETAWHRIGKETVDPLHSRLRQRFVAALGERRAQAYLPVKGDPLPGSRYRTLQLTLPPLLIDVETASLPTSED